LNLQLIELKNKLKKNDNILTTKNFLT